MEINRLPDDHDPVPDVVPSWADAIAAHLRGESLDPVDAFAELAGVSRDEWIRTVAKYKALHREGS